MKHEVGMCTKIPALTENTHQNPCALPGFVCAQSSCGCNKHSETRGNPEEVGRGNCPDYVDDSSLGTRFLESPAVSIKTLHVVFSWSRCSWKLKDHSYSNEIKNIDVTIPDFHQGIRLQSSIEIWVQNNFLGASRVAPALRLSPS